MGKKLTALLFSVFLLCFGASDLFAFDSDKLIDGKERFIEDNGDLPISAIRFEGLKRTRSIVVESTLINAPGDMLSDFNPVKQAQRLYGLGIIKSVSIDYQKIGDSVEVIIGLQEKWTLIAFPIYRSTEDGYMVGLFAMESNLLGYSKKLIVGGFFGSSGWNLMSIYIDPGIGRETFVFKMTGFVGIRDIEDKTLSDESLREYRTFNQRFSVSPGYKVDKLSFYTRLGYERFAVQDTEASGDVPGGNTFAVTGVSFEYNDLSYTGLKDTGLKSVGEYNYHYSLKGEGSGSLYEMTFDASSVPFWKVVAGVNISGAYGTVDELVKPRPAGKPSFQTLPYNYIASDKFSAGSAYVEFPYYSNRLIALSFITFAEGGVLSIKHDFDRFYTGIGGGTRFYLKGVAFPAMGIVGGYNFESKELVYTFSVGMM
jgi:hypothetical protein